MIRTATPVRIYTQDEFHQIDRIVTGQAFAIHNELGRILDERLYQRELAARCLKAGLPVHREMKIVVSHEDFAKEYFVDLLVSDGVIVEAKTAQTLIGGHTGQTLNYMFLCGTQHGTLLNFRPVSVQHKFVSTTLTSDERRRFTLHTEGWRPMGPEWERVREVMEALLKDWGAFLEPHLYRDALTHFLGGAGNVIRKIPVTTENGVIGEQEIRLLSRTVAFAVTAATRQPGQMKDHLRRFLQHTPLEAMAWINLDRHDIEFRSITR